MSVRVAVVGGGAFGLFAALALLRRGARVTLVDAAASPSASAVAAGMLAPVFEAAFDLGAEAHLPLLRAGAALWPSALRSAGLDPAAIDTTGGLAVAGPDEGPRLDALEARLTAAGAQPRRLTPAEAAALSPGLSPAIAGALFVAEEGRAAPSRLLPELQRRAQALGAELLQARAAWRDGGLHIDQVRWEGDAVVLAAGDGARGLVDAAPELRLLTPIKGQILAFDAPPLSGPTVRALAGGYVAPQPDGALAGATMEPGRSDGGTDPAALAGLRAQAAALFPHLAAAPAVGRAGVRAATPDGLPLAGPSRTPGVHLAAGARRNGWLLGPLVGEAVAAGVFGEAPSDYAAALDPRRFG